MKTPSVNGIIFDQNHTQILLIKRRDVSIWVIPGGAIDPGETPEEAITREMLEETGCVVEICRKAAIYHPVNHLTNTTHLFVCKIHQGHPKTGAETRDIGFFNLNELPRNFFHIHRQMLNDALNNEGLIIEKEYTGVTYTELLKYFLKHPFRVIRFGLSRLGFPINS